MKPDLFRFRFKSLSTSAALSVAAAVMLVPANLLPIVTTDTSGRERSDTILSGAGELWRSGLGAIAVIVFAASILIPVLKLAGLAWLICEARAGPGGRSDPRLLTKIYSALDFIARWSMLDVFLVAFLAGLIQFGDFSAVIPRSGIIAFAAAVVLTGLATQAFDPRVFWNDERSPAP